MNFSPKTCCRLCAKAYKNDYISVVDNSELGKMINSIYGVVMELAELSPFICSDCHVSAIAFSANFDRVQYIQGQLKKYSSVSSTSHTQEPKSVPNLVRVPINTKYSMKTAPKKPYNKFESAMKFKLGDKVKFVSSGQLVHGVIDGLFSKLGKYQIKTPKGEIIKIFHLNVLADGNNN